MCTLLTLPNETLLQIIAETCPDGIEELVLCCKRLHQLAQESMKQHKADRKQYWGRFLTWPRNLELRYGFEPAQPICLSEILFRPRIAYYVQHLCVSHKQLSGPPRASQPLYSLAMTTQDSAWRDFFARSRCTYISDMDSAHWQEALDRADVQTVTSSLLMLLPNLRTFYLTLFNDSSKISGVVNSIVNASQSVDRMHASDTPLSKLCYLRVSHVNRLATTGLWESFAMLPSMRCMRHGDFIREDFERWRSQEPGRSDIKELCFEFGDLSMETLTRLCGHTKSLETFVYNDKYARYAEDKTEDACNLSVLASLLQAHAGHSLKELCLTIQEPRYFVDPYVRNFVQNFPGPLRGFDRLEKVEITFNALLLNNAGTLDVPYLVDILPASLRELHIWVINEFGSVVELIVKAFAGVGEWKQTKLPRIELVVFRRHMYGNEMTELPLDNDTKLKCESGGISVEVRAWSVWRHELY